MLAKLFNVVIPLLLLKPVLAFFLKIMRDVEDGFRYASEIPGD